jgi:hypothetical protein
MNKKTVYILVIVICILTFTNIFISNKYIKLNNAVVKRDKIVLNYVYSTSTFTINQSISRTKNDHSKLNTIGRLESIRQSAMVARLMAENVQYDQSSSAFFLAIDIYLNTALQNYYNDTITEEIENDLYTNIEELEEMLQNINDNSNSIISNLKEGNKKFEDIINELSDIYNDNEILKLYYFHK